MRNRKKLLKQLAFLGFAFWMYSSLAINNASMNKTYDSVEVIPKNKVGLLLGVRKYLNEGKINLFYRNRLIATADLYHAQKIDYVLVSGDNSRKDYNEPLEFQQDLVRLGIPKEKIYLDFAGFRTLDSVVRAHEVFGLQKFTVISQEFHNKRAIYLSNHKELEVIGFNAKAIAGTYSIRTKLREQLAKSKAVLDIIFNVQPKFLGDPITIE